MSILPRDRRLQDKYCFTYCGPERCDCYRGHGLRAPGETALCLQHGRYNGEECPDCGKLGPSTQAVS